MRLVHNNYGKQRVRLVKVTRVPGRHEVKDVTVGVRLEGDYESVYAAGDNRACLPTDTMKNTVYALAAQHPVREVERFGALLAQHFLAAAPAVHSVRVEMTERLWTRVAVGGRPTPAAFTLADQAARTATVTGTAEGLTLEAGIADLVVLKSAGSGFEGFPRDRYTTLAETADRILATAVTAAWRYFAPDVEYNTLWQGVRALLVETFAEHESRSVQHTLYAMAEAVLERIPEIAEVRLSMPNRHHLPVDLTPFGLENRNEIFVATDEPYGLIEAVVRRGA